MTKKLWLSAAMIIWSAFVLLSGLSYYVNHNMPHGTSYETGDYVCENDGRGPCGLEHKEDLRNLNIPDWAKFFRNNTWLILWLPLGVAGIYASQRFKEIK